MTHKRTIKKKEEEIRAKYFDEIFLEHLNIAERKFALLLKRKFPGMTILEIVDMLAEKEGISTSSEDEDKLDEE